MAPTDLAQPTVPAAALVASVFADGLDTVVELRGDADMFTLPVVVDVLARVIAETDGPVIVDLASVESIDSGTERALFRASEFLNERVRTLAVRSPSTVAVRVLGPAGHSHLIEPARLDST